MRRADVTIIGGGPAGMSAALWCADLGVDAVLIERSDQFGGQLGNIFNPITNYLGVSAANGEDMRKHFLDSIRDSRFERLTSKKVEAVDASSMVVKLEDRSEIASKVIVLATGVRRRRLGITGETEFCGKGILESGARDRQSIKRKRVLVVGGGDAALENALLLSELASEVMVAFRREQPTARQEFVESALDRTNVRFFNQTRLAEIHGNDVVESVTLQCVSNGRRSTEDVDAVLIRIGVEPNSELIAGQAELNSNGYVIVNRRCETSLPGVFAIGDVANPVSPTISTAAGDGSTVAKAAFDFIREASGGK